MLDLNHSTAVSERRPLIRAEQRPLRPTKHLVSEFSPPERVVKFFMSTQSFASAIRLAPRYFELSQSQVDDSCFLQSMRCILEENAFQNFINDPDNIELEDVREAAGR